MKLLTEASSKRAYCDSQKDSEDILNRIIDIDYVKAINNCVSNSVIDMANHAIMIYLFILKNK